MSDQKDISVQLYEVLDAIGASEDIRKKYQNVADAQEICFTLPEEPQNSVYIFGSSSEGTTTRGMMSDVDMVAVDENFPVYPSLDEGPTTGTFLLMVSDQHIKPGYVKLQTVIRRFPQTSYMRLPFETFEEVDEECRLCLCHIDFSHLIFSRKMTRNGPAFTAEEMPGFAEMENLKGYRCRSIPKFANSWVHRPRHYNWPSEEQLRRMTSYGCFLVGVGHPQSRHKSIEWRISFSLQERDLMRSLNDTQYKCYILLKIIKKNIIHPKTGKKSITSYHCKTCLFYTIESTNRSLWEPVNLLQVTLLCLNRMAVWIQDGHCPNYFVPEENMFDKLAPDMVRKVANLLSELLSAGGMEFLYSITCDNVGNLIKEGTTESVLSEVQSENGSKQYNHLYVHWVCNIYITRNDILRKCCTASTLVECHIQTLNVLNHLNESRAITEHLPEEVKSVTDSIKPHIHLQCAQWLAAAMPSRENAEQEKSGQKWLEMEIKESADCDLISPHLILATYLLQDNQLGKCEQTLLKCQKSIESIVMSICRCHDFQTSEVDGLGMKLFTENMSFVEFAARYTTGCIAFLPLQATILHPVLQYEMFRSIGAPEGTTIPSIEYWFKWVVIDSKVYLYFLQYVIYLKLGNEKSKDEALKRLKQVIHTDLNLGHADTAYNLLGSILLLEGNVDAALLCFYESWKIRPYHNAAKWHLLILYYRRYLESTGSKQRSETIYERSKFSMHKKQD